MVFKMFKYTNSEWCFAKDVDVKDGYGIDSIKGYPIATISVFESIDDEERKGNASLIKHSKEMFEEINETLDYLSKNNLNHLPLYKKLTDLIEKIKSKDF